MLTRYIILQWQHNYLLKKINRNNHFHFQSLSFLREITEPLLIISKSLQFKLCHIKLTTLKVDPRSNHETCFR